jgi:hypothetical protein
MHQTKSFITYQTITVPQIRLLLASFPPRGTDCISEEFVFFWKTVRGTGFFPSRRGVPENYQIITSFSGAFAKL